MDAEAKLQAALDSGAAAEKFAQMVAAQGGPADLLERPEQYLAAAPVQRPVCAPRAGRLSAMLTREIGLAVVELGGGRRQAGDRIDVRVGLSAVLPLGTVLEAGQPFAMVHAADASSAERAAAAVLVACRFSDPEAPWGPTDLIQARVG